jgi:hypothetical protein
MYQKIFLLTVLLTASTLMHCQYKSLFGNNSTKYLIFETFLNGSEVNDHLSLGIIEDNDYLYHQFQFVLIREDTVTGKVWKRASLSDEEVLIMDMSLNIGDTMYLSQTNFYGLVYEVGNEGYALVQNIFYNEYGKNIELNCHTNNPLTTDFSTEESIPLRFIEGIGPNYSMFYGYLFYPENPYLVCSHKDDTLAFINTEFNTCDSTLFWEVGVNAVVNIFPKMQYSYHPNADYNSYNILFSDSFNGKISLYSISGMELFTSQINNELCLVLKKVYTFYFIILLQIYTFILILNTIYSF